MNVGHGNIADLCLETEEKKEGRKKEWMIRFLVKLLARSLLPSLPLSLSFLTFYPLPPVRPSVVVGSRIQASTQQATAAAAVVVPAFALVVPVCVQQRRRRCSWL